MADRNKTTEITALEAVGATGRPPGLSDSFLNSLAGEPPPDWDWNRLPMAVDRYEVQALIAHGGMGTLCLAQDKFLGQQLALKILRGEEMRDPQMVGRFRQEARIHAQLHHPGIPPLQDVGRMPDGRPFIAMKYVSGSTLAGHLGGKPVKKSELRGALALFERVCKIVAYAHAKGVVHRDLKPNNVLVSDRGRVWVIDWGLAKMVPVSAASDLTDGTTAVSLPDPAMTAEGVALGTLAYMPPEQAAGRVSATAPTNDVFCLGAILCEMLTGHPPFTSVIDGRDRSRSGQLAVAFARLERSAAPSRVVELVQSCLAPSPGDRPPTAAALGRALAKLRTEGDE